MLVVSKDNCSEEHEVVPVTGSDLRSHDRVSNICRSPAAALGGCTRMTAELAPDADQQLVERVQKGDKRAFDLLVIKYQHKILAIISRFIRDHAEVHDVAQDAF